MSEGDIGCATPGSSNTTKDDVAALHCHEVAPRLFIGDYYTTQSEELLRQHRIHSIVSAMKQKCPLPADIRTLHVPIDDSDKTNIIEWFDKAGDWIEDQLYLFPDEAVLVHCAAGISRSTTIVAAYLMRERRMSADDAIAYISSRRPQAKPIQFFLGQLEMYEACECAWDPAVWPAQRRFLMGFVADQMQGGDAPSKLMLAWYPSPVPSPPTRAGSDPMNEFSMTPLHSEPSEDNPSVQPRRQRLTQRRAPSTQPGAPSRVTDVERIGQGRAVAISGKRLRCKLCRRELASQQHVILHEPGPGPAAFNRHRGTKQHRPEVDTIPVRAEADPKDPGLEAHPFTSAGGDLANLSRLRVAVPPHATTEWVQPATKDEANSEPPVLSAPLLSSPACSGIFLEPMSWMADQILTSETADVRLAGRLLCPRKSCSAKLGQFDWSGIQCSCGRWIVPGFALSKSRVDEIAR